jgi:hypothetical protein
VTYIISPKWEVSSSVGWLSLNIDDLDGSYLYFDLSTEYRITERFGVGAGYQISKIDVEETKRDGYNDLDIEFSGPSIHLTYGF